VRLEDVKRALARDPFGSDWDRAIDALEGVSGGARRALKAHADVEVREVHASIGTSFDLFLAWRQWHPQYVRAEIERLLPELRKRWPTKAERKQREIDRQRRAYLLADVGRIEGLMLSGVWRKEVVRDRLKIKPKRFEAILSMLKELGAVRDMSGDSQRFYWIAPFVAVREKILALSPSL